MHQTKPSTTLAAFSLPELMTMADLALKLRRSRSGVDKLRARDSSFPKPIKEGTDRRSRVYFNVAEVDAWLRSKLEARAA
ncbi:MAG: helix-turn-helix transcriptional regulator [Pseudomonas sp.]